MVGWQHALRLWRKKNINNKSNTEKNSSVTAHNQHATLILNSLMVQILYIA